MIFANVILLQIVFCDAISSRYSTKTDTRKSALRIFRNYQITTQKKSFTNNRYIYI